MSAGETPNAGPVRWPEVIAKYGPEYERNLAVFESILDEIAEAAPPRYAGDALGGFDDTVAALAVLRGPAVARVSIDRVAPELPRIASQLTPTIDRRARLAAAYTLAVLNVARSCGAAVTVDAVALEAAWLPQLAAFAKLFTERERHTLALAASAARLPAATRSLSGLRTGADFAPAMTHGFDVPAFAGYLATAVEHGASYQDVEPAWLDFVHRFPYKFDTDMLGWPALLFAARAVYATIGGVPDAEVALELHKLVAGP